MQIDQYNSIYDPTMPEAMRVWRILKPLSHIFTDGAELLYEEEKISLGMMKFLREKGWPINKLSPMKLDQQVADLFKMVRPLWEQNRFEDLGYQMALIAYTLTKPSE